AVTLRLPTDRRFTTRPSSSASAAPSAARSPRARAARASRRPPPAPPLAPPLRRKPLRPWTHIVSSHPQRTRHATRADRRTPAPGQPRRRPPLVRRRGHAPRHPAPALRQARPRRPVLRSHLRPASRIPLPLRQAVRPAQTPALLPPLPDPRAAA